MQITKPQKLIYDMEKFVGGSVAVICGSTLLNARYDTEILRRAVNELYRINDALRIRITDADGVVHQEFSDYVERKIEVLTFDNHSALTAYAEEYAKIPLDLYGDLCEFQIISLPDQSGVLIKLHHIVGDAWTLSLLGNQLNDLLSGRTPTAYSYAKYIQNESAYLSGKRYEKDKKFFMEQFGRCDEVTFLSEKTTASYTSLRKTFVIEHEKAREIMDYAASTGSSPFMLFTTALAAYINRTKMNAESFYIGTAVLNRSTAEEKNTAGMFINTVPVLIELANELSFHENLSRIADSLFSVFRHQKFNYGDLLAALRSERHFEDKLYDVMISYQNATVDGECKTAWYHSGMQTESLQIHIDDRDSEGIFRIHYDYLLDCFSEKEIEVLHCHLINLLFSGIKNSSKKLYELDLLTEDERQKLLYDFNDTAIDYPKDKCVHELFEEQVSKTPDKTAVIACDRTMTYAELDEEADRIAHGLIEQGVKRGDIVAFCLPRRSFLISAMLGILKAGAAYLPIDPDYPQDRVDFMLSDSGARYYITEDNINDLIAVTPNYDKVEMNSKDFCYCLFTSGTTGKPKATVIKHHNLTNFANNNNNNYQHTMLGVSENVLALAAVTFDISVFEIFITLLNGLTLTLANETQLMSGEQIGNLIANHQVDAIHCTPTKFSMYLDDTNFQKSIKRIKVIMIGAEVFPEQLLNRIKSMTDAAIFNGYGPTETTIGVCFAPLDSSDITIGKPIANTQIYIVDQFMNPVPVGVSGELCIAGDCVGAGYLNRPELTAEKFVDNPFGEGKLYKTGDLAYWREDGNIVYVGRNDFQVKIRGLRIELGEIENAISSIEGITQAVVVVRKNDEGRQLICAFYTGQEVESKEIRDIIGRKLPKYMIPHIFTHLDAIPLTSSGKVSRKALPDVDLNATESGEYIAPRNDEETALADAVKSVLNLEKVGVLDSFFEIGGDSLKAIELIVALEKRGFTTDVRTIFEGETIENIAGALRPAERRKPAVRSCSDEMGEILATPAQMRVYTSQSMHTESTTYNVPYIIRTDGIDVERLQQAVDRILARHDILRTCFQNKNGRIIQKIDNDSKCTVEKLRSDCVSDFVRPFDMSKAPLFRVGYYDNIVMIDMHHTITDGGSMPLFLKELNDLYMGRELELPAVQYRDFSVSSIDYADDKAYWLSVFGDELPELTINTDFKRGGKQSFKGAAVYDTISKELDSRISELCRKSGFTPFVFYLAAFHILLSKYSGCEDIIVGAPVSGRNEHYIETLGMFVNTVALRSKPIGTKTIKDYLQEVKRIGKEALEHQFYPFGELVKELGLNVSDRNPLFDVVFAFQSNQMTEVTFGDAPAELLPVPLTTSKYDMTFNIMPRNDDIAIMVEYCTELYKEETILRLIRSYCRILEQMLDTGKKLMELSAVVPEERQKLLFDFNDTAIDYPKDKCVHELFEDQVCKSPEKTAVIACDRTMTYAELNEEANRIAHGLIEQGVKRGDIVAFCLPRRSLLISTMLGILKAGAAYLPIDPDYPQDRVDFMLNDSGARYYITEDNINDLIAVTPNYDKVEMSSDDFCYCLFTSGTTGNPKATVIKHHNLTNFANNNNNNYQHTMLGISENVLALAAVTFDISVFEIFITLLNGLTLTLANETQLMSGEQIGELIADNQVDAIHCTPTKFSMYLNDATFQKALKRIKVIMIGAEVFPEQLLNRIKSLTDAAIFNGYGPTETTIGVCFAPLNSSDITIGKPIANTQIFIVDKYMNPVSIGVSGELCIAGDCVGAGYLNRPEMTAEKFIDNPFGEGKLYKTGDLAYWREDGNIVYVGRNDFQVKIRGLRIELGEIETAISSIEGITQAVVVVRKNDDGRQLICAFYTGQEIEPKEIRAVIGKKLPKYMIPHIFTHLDVLPLTSSGKVSRKALPDVDLYNISADTNYVAPHTELQKALCGLMEKVLQTSPVGIDDDFFDLGGDSLKAIEFVSDAHYAGIYFKLQNMFDHPTVRALADCIENEDSQSVNYADYDFSAINRILAKNTITQIKTPEKSDLGNIMIAGATGFLGIHLLSDFLDHNSGTAYCLVRGKTADDCKKRLDSLLHFYFGDKYDDTSRIKIVCADLQKDRLGLSEEEYNDLLANVHTVFNSAALVKHFGSYQFFYEVNVATAVRLIDFCKSANARLIHISTYSVSGNGFRNDSEGVKGTLYEHDLYIGQALENVYAHSKFEAEKAVLEAMSEGLQANIMRMGNLSNRYSDGVFQRNYESNANIMRLKAMLELGVVPDYMSDFFFEFTPIDEAAKAVMTIARHFSNEQTLFYIYSSKLLYVNDMMNLFNSLDYYNIQMVSGEEFAQALRATATQSGKEYIYETFINDMDENYRLHYEGNIQINSEFSVEYLRRLGFEWKDIDLEYIRKYVDYFRKIGYFK